MTETTILFVLQAAVGIGAFVSTTRYALGRLEKRLDKHEAQLGHIVAEVKTIRSQMPPSILRLPN